MDSVRGAQDGQRRRRSSLEQFRLKGQLEQAAAAAEEEKDEAEGEEEADGDDDVWGQGSLCGSRTVREEITRSPNDSYRHKGDR